jgi:hypothetical protein
MRRLVLKAVLLATLTAAIAAAQEEVTPRDPNLPPSEPLPTGVILLPGAVPRSSDAKTALPENGRIARDVYRNAYFGMTYKLPDEWSQRFSGPPPSDTGLYVLAELSSKDRGSILITAQDLFFALTPASTAEGLVKFSSDHLPAYYQRERPPSEIEIANHKFSRFDYGSPAAELHWYVLATEIRCHAVQFVLTSRDTKLLDSLIDTVNRIEIDNANAPLCIPNYARAENITYKVDPQFVMRRGESMPVRILIGKTGNVEHVHVISAFPEQAAIITDALLQWKFKPYIVNGEAVPLETGLLFGTSRKPPQSPKAASLE